MITSHLTTDQLLYLILNQEISAADITEEQLLEVELEAMSRLATIRAGGDHMVLWDLGTEDYH